MPHISSKKLSAKAVAEIERNLESVFSFLSGNQQKKIYQEVLTSTEHIMIAKRIALILLVSQGMSAYKISLYLGISPSTAERFERMYNRGKFRNTVRLRKPYKGIGHSSRVSEFPAIVHPLKSF